MGLPGLKGISKDRVTAAKFLYTWTVKMILRLHAAGVAWSVENPASSLMWLTTPFQQLLAEIPDLIAFSFHTCMFQAKRKKDTALWTSMQELRTHLERKCDEQHEHLPWGRATHDGSFATAEECAYNENMCASWAQAVADFAGANGYNFSISDMSQTKDSSANLQINKAILGCLPRGRKVPPLLTDWLEPQLFQIDHLPVVQTLPVGKRIPDSVQIFPKGSKLVRFTNENGGDAGVQVAGDNASQNVGLPRFALVGIPREPGEFIARACSLTHPLLQALRVGGALNDAIDAYELGDRFEFRHSMHLRAAHAPPM